MNSETMDTIANAILRLKFDRPIVFFDLETTGIEVAKDRICSISALKVFPNGEVIEKDMFINPGIPIPLSAIICHGITDEMVKDTPLFKQIAIGLRDFISGCDLAGFNSNNFDIPLLAEEFARIGINCPEPGTQFLDIFNIFRKKEPRDLSAAVKFYLQEEHIEAHNSLADIKATFRVFASQLLRYPDLTDKTIVELSEIGVEVKRVDFAGHILIDSEGDYIYGSGKHKGTKIKTDMGFADWMLKQNHYTITTKNTVTRVLKELREQKTAQTSIL